MRFDARTAKQLSPNTHMVIDGYPGLRLEASASRRSWVYRFKSPIDARMRQIKIGEWPAMSLPAAAVEWERLRAIRDGGGDPVLSKREAMRPTANMVQHGDLPKVRAVCRMYLEGHVERRRKSKGAKEVKRMFDTMLGPLADQDAATLSRAKAFDLLERFAHIPVQAAKLRAELGAAWDYALDAGRLPENTPNWWRMIMRGRLRSTGKRIKGRPIGTSKRVLAEDELGRLINWLPNLSRLLEDVLTLYIWTGTRGSEIVAMEGREVRLEADGLWWTIPKWKTKNARHENATDLRVPLIGRAQRIVERRVERHGDGYLFPSERVGHTQQKVIQSSLYLHQPYSETRPEVQRPRLPVTHWAPHDLRRTVRTLLAAMDCSHEVAEAVLGHMLPGVGGVYNRHRYDEQRRVWLDRLSAKLEELARLHPLIPSAAPSLR